MDIGPISVPFELASGQTATAQLADLSTIYKVKTSSWYTIRPYGFVLRTRAYMPGNPLTDGKIVVMLPINPSNINTVTHFATNVVTTLYGVVEEHSEIRYYDITISGTTGYAPKFVSPTGISDTSIPAANTNPVGAQSIVSSLMNLNANAPAKAGRQSFTDAPGISLGGFAAQTVGVINTAVSTVTDLFSSENETGVDPQQSGYLAFHNLYRTFQIYKKDTSGEAGFAPRKAHPLSFINYKDNIMYDCVPRVFTLTRSADSPMLYNYQIVLRAYNLRTIGSNEFAGTYQDKLATLGLGGAGDSLFAQISNIAGGAATAVAGLSSLAGGFGG